jgi:type 1 glutamine amidotransferase
MTTFRMKDAATQIEAALIASGPFHDIAYVRQQLLGLLGDEFRIRTRVFEDYTQIEAITAADVIVSYTCDVVADDAQSAALRGWLERGGRWFALHATNATLAWVDGKVVSPDRSPAFMELLGSSFAAHPPLGLYRVEVADPDHPLVQGLESFEVRDEQYLGPVRAPIHVLLDSHFAGETPRFQVSQWPAARHPVLYVRELGRGAVLYFTMGHSFPPPMEVDGGVDGGTVSEGDHCSWNEPIFRELLRRGVGWLVERNETTEMTRKGS